MLRNASAMIAEREALRKGIEHLTVLFPTEVSSFDFQVECTDRTVQYKLDAQSLRLFGLYRDVNDAHRAGANRLQNKNKQSTRSESTSRTVRGDASHEPAESKDTNKNGDNETVRGNLLHDLPEWLEEFTEKLVGESVPAHRDAPASSSRESASEPRGKVVSGKHSIYTHFPKDRNCDICMRTKKTKAPCRKLTGAAVPRAEHFGDLMTADHKVLSEGCESRNNHRYAVVVQDLATQWIQSYSR